jgi:hypothetical protein
LKLHQKQLSSSFAAKSNRGSFFHLCVFTSDSEQLAQLHQYFGDFLANFHQVLDTDTILLALKSLIDFAIAISDANVSAQAYSTILLLLGNNM